jgi:hypothetical protein
VRDVLLNQQPWILDDENTHGSETEVVPCSIRSGFPLSIPAKVEARLRRDAHGPRALNTPDRRPKKREREWDWGRGDNLRPSGGGEGSADVTPTVACERRRSLNNTLGFV